ncbi:tetratricopeptide repeat protein [Gimesia aquarii]|uniref:Cellulose synthase subunit BcsC n=1 Tax=Gimesia aquarii TaxID=2527964 RepID=A0A517WZE2_9PLAN|nr:tetratricopeptide repeat protein [Gimesia aquarii]QDU10620.1 cellulose synthase subunit BcsC [Gimesia aquarii]
MKPLPEQDKLTKPFPMQKKSILFSSKSIVAVVAVIALLIFYFYGGTDSSRSKKSGQINQIKTVQKAEKVKQNELIAYLKQHPQDEFAHFQLGELIKDRAPFQALENFSHVTPMHPRYYEAVDAIAEISLKQNLPKQAKKALLTLIRKFPQQSRYQDLLAKLLLEERDYDRALKHATRSIELGANQAENHMLVANILRQAGRTSEMCGPLKQALFLEPESLVAHLNLAYAALYSGDLQTAEREALWCLKQNPLSNTALRYLAQIDRSRGNISEALAHIEQALVVDPEDFESLLLKADLLIYQRAGQQAYDLLKPLYLEHQTDRRYITALSRAAGLIGNRKEVLQLQRQNQLLIKEDDLKPSTLQSETIEDSQSR